MSETPYQSAYTGIARDRKGDFAYFTIEVGQHHLQDGYWRFHSWADQRNAYLQGIHSPEELLRAFMQGEDTYRDISLDWMTGQRDEYLKEVVKATVEQHLAVIHAASQHLGLPSSRSEQVPFYPIDSRLYGFWVRQYPRFVKQQKQQGTDDKVAGGNHVPTRKKEMVVYLPPEKYKSPSSVIPEYQYNSPYTETPSMAAHGVQSNPENRMALGYIMENTAAEPVIPHPTEYKQATLQPAKLTASDLVVNPRCKRCVKNKKGCNRKRPCQNCKTREDCVIEDKASAIRYANRMVPSAPKGQLSLHESVVDFQPSAWRMTPSPAPFHLENTMPSPVIPILPTVRKGLQIRAKDVQQTEHQSPYGSSAGRDVGNFVEVAGTEAATNPIPNQIDSPEVTHVASNFARFPALVSSTIDNSATLDWRDGSAYRAAETAAEPDLESISTPKGSESFASTAREHLSPEVANAGADEGPDKDSQPPSTTVVPPDTESNDATLEDHVVNFETNDVVTKVNTAESDKPNMNHEESIAILQTSQGATIEGLPGGEEPAASDDEVTFDLCVGLPCMDCGQAVGHRWDCNIGTIAPMKHLKSRDIRNFAILTERIDPDQSIRMYDYAEPENEDPETQIKGMAEFIRDEESYTNDATLHALPDALMILLWAVKNAEGVELTSDANVIGSEHHEPEQPDADNVRQTRTSTR